MNESPQPANDDFANAAVLTENENENAFASGTNAGASKETGEPSHAGEAGGHSVWWTWTAPRSGVVHFQNCGSPNVDTLLAVYTGDAVGALSEVASAPADSNCIGSNLSFRASGGVTYHIAVDGAGGSIGGFYLSKQPTPRNDEFENATPLSGLSAKDYGFNSSATSEPGEPNHAGNGAGRSLWWRWTAPANGPVQIDTCDSGGFENYFDTVLAVYTGDAVDALSLVASNNDLASCVPASGVAFTASAGTTYQIAVDGAPGLYATGIIGLSLRETAASVGPPPAPPSNEFSFGEVKKNKTEGSAKLIVEVPGPGRFEAVNRTYAEGTDDLYRCSTRMSSGFRSRAILDGRSYHGHRCAAGIEDMQRIERHSRRDRRFSGTSVTIRRSGSSPLASAWAVSRNPPCR